MQSYTPTQFSKLTGITRETIQKRVDGVEPVETEERGTKVWKYYTLKQYLDAFVEWERQRNSPGNINREHEQARVYQEQANKLERERLDAEGKTLDAEDVEREWTGAFSGIKSRLLAACPKIGVKTAKVTDPAECESIAHEHITDALEDLSKGNYDSQ